MGDLEVDLDLLAETAGSLGMLIHELDRASSVVEHGDDAVGDNALREELHVFVDEWEHQRQRLLASMQAVQKMASASRRAYVETDDALARAITEGSS